MLPAGVPEWFNPKTNDRARAKCTQVIMQNESELGDLRTRRR